jgi:hypothetical protein
VNKPTIGLRKAKHQIQLNIENYIFPIMKQSTKIPTQCPKCKSENIMGYGAIMGYGYINLEDMSVNDPGDDWDIFDEEDLELCLSRL